MWGRIPNTIVHPTTNQSAYSLMAIFWIYQYPESPLLKWELTITYCDAETQTYLFPGPAVAMPLIWISVPSDRLQLYLKWYQQRLVHPSSRRVEVRNGRAYIALCDTQSPILAGNGAWALGQGAAWTGFFLDQTRLITARADWNAQTMGSPYQYWINAIAQKSVWDGNAPVNDVLPKAPTAAVADGTVAAMNAHTHTMYTRSMDTATTRYQDTGPDPLFDSRLVDWTPTAESLNPTGPQREFGASAMTCFVGLADAGQPDAIEYVYWGHLASFGLPGKWYHQGPDGVARTDQYGPRKSKTDGSMYAFDITNPVGPVTDEDSSYVWGGILEQRDAEPVKSNSLIVWNIPSANTGGHLRGISMRGTDLAHWGNLGLTTITIMTGSWMLLELSRSHTVNAKYAVRPIDGITIGNRPFEQQRQWRTYGTIVNGYWAEHESARRAQTVAFLTASVNKRNEFDGKGNARYQGFETFEDAGDYFFGGANRFMNQLGSGENRFPPVVPYQMTFAWQMGANAEAMWHIGNLITDNQQRFKDHIWAAFYSYVMYCWRHFDEHPDAPYLDELCVRMNDRDACNNRVNTRAFCPGWVMVAHLAHPGAVLGVGGQESPLTSPAPADNWLAWSRTIDGETRDLRGFYNYPDAGWLKQWHVPWMGRDIDGDGAAGCVAHNNDRDWQKDQSCRIGYNTGHEFRRIVWANSATDWQEHYGVRAMRVARLITNFRVDVPRNTEILDPTRGVLAGEQSKYDAKNYTAISNTDERWRALVGDMDWVWPTDFLPDDPPDAVRTVVAQPPLFFQTLATTESESRDGRFEDADVPPGALFLFQSTFVNATGVRNTPHHDDEPIRDTGEGGSRPPVVRPVRPASAYGPVNRRTPGRRDEP